MAPKKRRTQQRPARKMSARKRAHVTAASPAKTDDRRLAEISETLDIMLPTPTSRIAAVEHVLVETEICDREELLEARAFVDERALCGVGGDQQARLA